MHKRCRAGSNDGGLAFNGHRHRALHQQKEFFMLVPVGRMGFSARGEGGLVNFQMAPRVGHAVKDRPGFIRSVCLYRQFAKRG